MKRRNITGIKPRSAIAFADSTYWFRAKLHEAAGETTFNWTGFGSSGAASGSETIDGTTTNIFDEFGEFKSAGDNGTTLSAPLLALWNDIYRTDNLNDGTIMVLGDVSRNTTSADAYLFAFNNPTNATNGNGYGIKLITATGKLQLFSFLGAANLLSATALDTSNTKKSFALCLQGDTTINMFLALDGVQEDTDTTTTLAGSATHVSLFSRAGNTGTPADDMQANSRISEFLAFRTVDDVSADFVEIASEYRDSKGNLTWSMDGL